MLLTGCGTTTTQGSPDPPGSGSGPAAVTSDELALASAATRDQLRDQAATVTGATVRAVPGRVRRSNVGEPCTSGRLLRITVAGWFPHILTTGHPLAPGEVEDFAVTSLLLTVDAVSGRPCRLGVATDPVPTDPRDVPLDLG